MTALFVPVVFLVLIIILEQLTPVATVDAIQHAHRDRTFIHFGLEPDLVPQSVGLYRVGHPDRRAGNVRGPDGQTGSPARPSRCGCRICRTCCCTRGRSSG